MNKKIVIAGVIVLTVGFLIWQVAIRQKTTEQIVSQTEQKTGAASAIVVPKNLVQCTQELLATNCDKVKEETVCGYDHTIYESGKEKDNTLQFKSACHYCKFYGLMEKNVAGTRIKGLGYENKSCSQGMYKKM